MTTVTEMNDDWALSTEKRHNDVLSRQERQNLPSSSSWWGVGNSLRWWSSSSSWRIGRVSVDRQRRGTERRVTDHPVLWTDNVRLYRCSIEYFWSLNAREMDENRWFLASDGQIFPGKRQKRCCLKRNKNHSINCFVYSRFTKKTIE